MTISRRVVVVIAGALVLLTGAAIALVLLLPGTSSTAGKGHSRTEKASAALVSKTFTISGSITVAYSSVGGYQDIRSGAQVEVTNERNEILAVGSLTSGSGGTYWFTVTEVPTGHRLYGVHVGNANRGVVWKSETEAKAGFFLSLG